MKLQKTAPFPPVLAIFFGILAISTSSIFIRFAQTEADSFVIAAYRMAIAALVLAPFALSKYRDELANLNRGDLHLGLLSGAFLGIHFATWISSLEYTTVTSSVVLVSTTPLWVAIYASLVMRESIGKTMVLGMVAALVGGVIVGFSDSCIITNFSISCQNLSSLFEVKAIFGDFLALIGAWAGAGYIIIGSKLRANISLIPYIFIVNGFSAIILIILTMSSSQPVLGYSPTFYLWVTLMALVPQLLGHSIYNWALRYLSAVHVSIILLGDPIGAAILAFFLLGEVPAPIKLFGAILILVGIYIASVSQD